MRVGAHLVSFDDVATTAIPDQLARAGRAAEGAGWVHLSLMDHFFQMEHMGGPSHPMLEGYTGLGFLAAHTSQLRLGLLVTGVTYRHPGLLAKIVATVDVLSGGRGELGIGAAWYDREHRGLGVPFPPTAERFERLEEALQVCLQMWGDDDGPYRGTHYQLDETICLPRPVSSPRPPILVGGMGERKTLRLVAQYADACNLFTTTPEEIGHKLSVLREHCDRLGRDYDSIEKTITVSGADVAGLGERLAPFGQLGIQTALVVPPDGRCGDWLEEHAERISADLAPL